MDMHGLNVAVELWGITFCVLAIACTLIFSRADGRFRGFLITMFSLEMVAAGADALAGIFRGGPGAGAWIATHLGNLVSFAAGFFLLAAFTSYLCARLEEASGDAFRPWQGAVWIAASAMTVLTALGAFYTIGDDNVYVRGDLHWITLAYAIVIDIVNAVLVIRNRRAIGGLATATLLFYTVVPVIASCVQIAVYGLNFIFVAGVLSLVVILLEMQAHSSRIIVERSEELARSQVELSESRIAVMVSQIQPHFIFNTLDSIYQLCAEDPSRAQQAIDNFSTFLRANLDSLSRTAPVPIETELAHVRTYLELEKMSLEDLLEYQIDAQATGFAVPALCIQTLAENAVKHGVGKKVGGGKVVVRTRERNDCYLVSVIDDGVGFDVDSLRSTDRVGIENTRARLEALCNGTLELMSTPGEGTLAVVRIPKEA